MKMTWDLKGEWSDIWGGFEGGVVSWALKLAILTIDARIFEGLPSSNSALSCNNIYIGWKLSSIGCWVLIWVTVGEIYEDVPPMTHEAVKEKDLFVSRFHQKLQPSSFLKA